MARRPPRAGRIDTPARREVPWNRAPPCREGPITRYLGTKSRRRGAFCRAPNHPESIMADHDLFFSRTGMDRAKVQQTVDQALKGSDDGELYLEYSQSESFSFDD